MICKPDVITPGTVMELVDICKESGVPEGVVNFCLVILHLFQNELMESDIIKKVSLLDLLELEN